jgi:hypothetical protein
MGLKNKRIIHERIKLENKGPGGSFFCWKRCGWFAGADDKSRRPAAGSWQRHERQCVRLRFNHGAQFVHLGPFCWKMFIDSALFLAVDLIKSHRGDLGFCGPQTVSFDVVVAVVEVANPGHRPTCGFQSRG